MDFILARIQPHPVLFVLCASLCVVVLWPLAWLLFPPGATDDSSHDDDPSWFSLLSDNYSSTLSFGDLFWLLRSGLFVAGYCGAVALVYTLLVRTIA